MTLDEEHAKEKNEAKKYYEKKAQYITVRIFTRSSRKKNGMM